MASRRFFDKNDRSDAIVPDGTPAEAVEYSVPRAMTAGVEQLDLTKRQDKLRQTQAWQTAACGFADQIGEVKYAFGLTANVTSRARFYAGVIDNNDEPPVDVESFLSSVESVDTEQHSTHLVDTAKIADEAIRDLFRGGQARLTRILALNLQVTGEAYIFDNHGIWDVASVREITWGEPPRLQRSKYGGRQGQASGVPLKQGAYIARVYREHALFAADADSNMLGVLDACEQVVLFDQMMRTITRSRLSAPVWTVPSGTVALNGKPIDEAIRELVQQPIEDESALYTIAPLILQLPEGQKIEQIDLGRKVDEAMVSLQENYLQRILDGLDIPKDMVSGMEGVRYSNALAVNDNYYKGHIEPLLVLISDILTYAYLRPMLHKAGVSDDILDRFVVWYNPAAIVTRPDRSASADTGYAKKLISGSAWRRAHGWSEHDAPSEDEVLIQLALERAIIPPDMSPALIENINPAFFAKIRQMGQDAAGIPSDIAQLLEGGPGTTATDEEAVSSPATGPAPAEAPAEAPATPAAPLPPDPDRAEEINRALSGPSDGTGEIIETEGQTRALEGDDLQRGGTMPPRPR
jgi:hypothetical protein